MRALTSLILCTALPFVSHCAFASPVQEIEGFGSPEPDAMAGIQFQDWQVVGEHLFFSGKGAAGNGTWFSDGTAEGTCLLVDGKAGDFVGSLNGEAYFILEPRRPAQLWKSDGTLAGTTPIKDIVGSNYVYGYPAAGPAIGGVLLFSIEDGVHGVELWRTDGTAEGTTILKDIYPGAEAGATLDAGFAEYNGLVYFAGRTAETGWELYQTDGTAEGTALAADLVPGSDSSTVGQITRIGDALYFTTGNYYLSYYKAQGSPLVITKLADTDPSALVGHAGDYLYIGSYGSLMRIDTVKGGLLGVLLNAAPGYGFEYKDQFYYPGQGWSGYGLIKTNGTTGGTILVKVMGLDQLVRFQEKLLMRGSDAQSGFELWESDGTSSGTRVLKDIKPGAAGSFDPSGDHKDMPLLPAGDRVFFSADDGVHGREVWTTDGSSAGTVQVANLSSYAADEGVQVLHAFGGRVAYVSGTGSDSRLYLGDEATTEPLNLGAVRLSSGTFRQYLVIGNTLYFAGSSLKYIDLESGASGVVYEPNPPASLSYTFRREGDGLYFAASAYNRGKVLYYPGAGGEVELVADNMTDARLLTECGGKLLFIAFDPPVRAYALEAIDFETRAVELLSPIINFDTPQGIYSIAAGDRCFLFEGLTGLWATDGTPSGTMNVAKISMPGSYTGADGYHGPYPFSAANINGVTVFPSTQAGSGVELWRTDGTTTGTLLFADIWEGAGDANPMFFTVFPDSVVFVASSRTHGRELFRTDGTTEGTTLLADLWPGYLSSEPSDLIALSSNRLLASADVPRFGRELFVVNIDTGESELLQDLVSGPASSGARDINRTGSRLFLTAKDADGKWAAWQANTPTILQSIGLSPTGWRLE